MNNIILIPAYKPEQSFVDFSSELVARGHKIIAVDDGGGEAFADIFNQVEKMGVVVLHHEVNRGKGAALRTGFDYLAKERPDVDGVVTADCDGQHKIADIEKVIAALEENPGKMIIGGRFSESNVKIPIKSRLGNTATRWIFRLATGLSIRDTQTGLRGIPQNLFAYMHDIPGDRYDFEMNMLLYLKNWKCGFVEIPIETVYINNNAGSHYHGLRDSMIILRQIIRFCESSLVCFLIDYILFIIFSATIHEEETFLFTFSLAYILARVISASVNYVLNRRFVFKKGSGSSVFKYILLAFCVMMVGSTVTSLLGRLEIPSILCKIMIDIPLYFVNYYFQKKWVFKTKKGKQ